MKRGLVIVLVLSLLAGMMSFGSFAAVRNYQNGSNYQNGGMMRGNFAGRGGMMNGNFAGCGGTSCNRNLSNNDGPNAGILSENAISLEAAYAVGKSYLEKKLSSEYTLDKEGIASGTYYTFFIESADKTVGRLSINALTSEVWLHNCRGLLQ